MKLEYELKVHKNGIKEWIKPNHVCPDKCHACGQNVGTCLCD